MDPAKGGLSLPGWDESYSAEGLSALLEEYAAIDAEKLWENLAYFIRAIMPACEEAGVNMAIHPDDPPWDIFGLPRIVTNEKNLDRLLSLHPSRRNGLTLCTGSLGASPGRTISLPCFANMQAHGAGALCTCAQYPPCRRKRFR